MTVTSATSRVSYSGNGSTVTFAVPFYFVADADLRVVRRSAAGVETPLVLTADYAVTGAGDENGGAITLGVAPAAGEVLVLYRDPPITQTADYVEGGRFPAASHERVLDKLTMIAQRSRELSARSLVLGETDTDGAGAYRANGNRITGLGAPSDPADAVSKIYLDTLAGLASGSFTQAGTGAIARTVDAKLKDLVSVKDFGAVGDGAVDDTTAIRNAITAAGQRPVYLPKGSYRVTDILTLNNGQRLYGDDRVRSVISVPASFNVSALGVVRLATAETGAAIYDIGFEFYQDPTAATRAALVHYPPAIYAKDASRFIIDRVRISGGWNGVDATGNCGGFYIGRLECGTYNKGLYIDGILDFAFVNSFHFWSFGISGVGTPNGDIFRDGTNVALEIGLAEQLNIGSAQIFRGNVNFTASGSGSVTPRFINDLCIDSDNTFLNHAAGYTEIGRIYNTKTNTATGNSISVTGGELQIAKLYTESGELASGVLVTGGRCKISGGRVRHKNAAYSAFECAGGRLTVDNVDCIIPDSARTVGYIKQTSGSLKARGNVFDGRSAGSGPGIEITADTSGNVLRDNNMGNWAIAQPSGGAGIYQNNDDTWLGYFSADGTTTVKVPSGWTVTRNSTGNYSITHSLGLAAAFDVAVFLTPHGSSTSDTTAYLDAGNSTTNVLRIRTFAAGVAADAALFFEVKRRRNL